MRLFELHPLESLENSSNVSKHFLGGTLATPRVWNIWTPQRPTGAAIHVLYFNISKETEVYKHITHNVTTHTT